MKMDEIYKDVHKALLDDQKYQQVLETMSEEEKKQTEAFMKKFMEYWQDNAINPLIEKIEKEPEFKKALYQKMSELIPNKSGE